MLPGYGFAHCLCLPLFHCWVTDGTHSVICSVLVLFIFWHNWWCQNWIVRIAPQCVIVDIQNITWKWVSKWIWLQWRAQLNNCVNLSEYKCSKWQQRSLWKWGVFDAIDRVGVNTRSNHCNSAHFYRMMNSNASHTVERAVVGPKRLKLDCRQFRA